MDTLNNQVISIIRTFVPVLVGQIMTWFAAKGILDSEGSISSLLITGLTLLFTTSYYAIVRFCEVYLSPRFGWLIGYAKRPVYTETKVN
jgi:hypothetical protein